MTEQEYDRAMYELEKMHKREKDSIGREYSISHSPYQIGDIIKDNSDIGKILAFGNADTFRSRYPTCIYHCQKLTKKLEQHKRQQFCDIHQLSVKEKIR